MSQAEQVKRTTRKCGDCIPSSPPLWRPKKSRLSGKLQSYDMIQIIIRMMHCAKFSSPFCGIPYHYDDFHVRQSYFQSIRRQRRRQVPRTQRCCHKLRDSIAAVEQEISASQGSARERGSRQQGRRVGTTNTSQDAKYRSPQQLRLKLSGRGTEQQYHNSIRGQSFALA